MTGAQISEIIAAELGGKVAGKRIVVLVPDHTRRLPLDRILPSLAVALRKARQVTVVIALGTHPPEPQAELDRLAALMRPLDASVVNHDWRGPALTSVGVIPAARIREIAGDVWHHSLDQDLEVRVNRAVTEADRVVIVGPTLPHEVAGYSGGTKYLFPGVSGPEMIDVMHWLGALTGVLGTIGVADTPVRRLIDAAAALVPAPVTLLAAVTADGGLADLCAGPPEVAWPASVERAAPHHVTQLDAPVERVVSCPLPIYPELWTAAKAVYKLAPAVADGGELTVYAPALAEVSRTHGGLIRDVGYHVMDYFLADLNRFRDVPLAVLAHSTHVKGAGSYAAGVESPRIAVRLATSIPREECQILNLGWADPAAVDLDRLARGGTMVVRDSGEHLYRAGVPSP